MNNLLNKCNADVFALLMDYKYKFPESGDRIIEILQRREYCYEMLGHEILSLSAILPKQTFDGKIYNLHLLFQCQPNSKMP